ncbi:MAG: TonB-dependent receptor [Asticcacaulis sp.]|uniref:TonB-dependent receptor n=1 Tax=Asticcacaulis sp. TaxID=1872648 RepID=UPI003F7CBCE7
MKKLNLRSGLMATTTICGAVLSTMAVPALVAGVAALTPATASAQDYTSGAIAILVDDPNGAPVAGATVTLVSKAQGITKTLTTNASGTATATGLSAGQYSVSVSAPGFDTYTDTATIVVSQEVTYTYAMQTTGAQATTVVVKGKRVRQDFNKTTTGLQVDLTTLTAQQPIGRSIEAVTLLAPTVVNSTAFGEPSIGGGSAAENAFYINGLNVTNPDTYVGGAEVPFDFYKTVDVQTSGSPAEFGRATGGVVNATTKNGTNDFMFAVHGNFAPNSLRSAPFAPSNTTNPVKFRESDLNSISFESGGALIKDKLFLYGLVQLQDNKTQFSSWSAGYLERDESKDPFYGLKADWYITPDQHLELTYFDTSTTTHQTRYAYSCPTMQFTPGQPTPAGFKTCNPDGSDAIIDYSKGYGATQKTGGPSWVLKYTGAVTDWFTVSAAYGDTKDANDFQSDNPDSYYAQEYHRGYFLRDSTDQIYSAGNSKDDWERKFTRLDGDIRFQGLGKHHIRFGYDHEDLSMTKTTVLPGGQPIRYYLLPDYSYGYIIYESLGGKVSSKDSAYYIQDSWDITRTLNVQVGLRNDDFQASNLSGQRFLNLTGNLAPRIGLSWKPSEDSNWRFSAYYGQQYIPPAMNLGFRGKDYYFAKYFLVPNYGTASQGWTFDSHGIPTAMGDPMNGSYNNCPPIDISGAPGNLGSTSDTACGVFGNGTQEPAAAKAAIGLKATRETEINLGANYRLNDEWTFGLTFVQRTLDRVSEDTDFAPQINAYCASKGYTCSFSNEYHVWNIGDSVTINTFHTLPTGENQITLTGLGFPKPTRKYQGLTFDFKRAFDGKWGIQGSYTYSKSKGNYEGTVLSTGSGSGQEDAGSTMLYDYIGLSDNSYGILPNSRDHEFKVWGSYAVTPDFLIGANVQVISPYYYSCFGRYPDKSNPAYLYGHYSHYCFNGTTYEPSPMGHGGKSDWTKTIDLSMRYTVPGAVPLGGGKLILRADIFNLLNDKEVLQQNNSSDAAFGHSNPLYGTPTVYNTARYMRIGFDLTY